VPALDGLRGLAVLGVVLFHGGRLRGGYLGVDLFFVLSGYLITSLLVVEWRSSAERTIDKARFWGRRARRLLPALFLVLLVVAAAAHSAVAPVARGGLRDDGLATVLYVANWHAIGTTTGYWAQTLAPSWLQHTWSLAIEEQFYVIWPLVVIAVLAWGRRRGDTVPLTVRRLMRVALVGAVASAVWMVLWFRFGHPSTDRLYLGTDTRAAALLMGAALACWQQLGGHTTDAGRRRWLTAAALVAAVFLAAAWTRVGGTDPALYEGVLAGCGLAVVVVIADATHPHDSVLARAWSITPLRWLGLISYGLYLWHWPIFQYLGRQRTGLDDPWALFGVRVVASIAVATLSFIVLEQPIRQRRFLRGVSFPAVAPLVGVAVVIAILVGTSGAVAPGPGRGPVARPTGRYINARPGATHLMVLGDSVAELLSSDGIAPQTKTFGVSLLPLASPGCNLNYSTKRLDGLHYDCSPQWPPAVQMFKPDVIMILFGSWKSAPLEIGGKNYYVCDPPFRQKWHDDLQRSLTELERVSDAPIVLVSATDTENPFVLDQSPSNFHELVRCANDVVREVADADPQVHFVDLNAFVCPGGQCVDRMDGVVLRPDFQHFREDGARLVARWLIPEVLAAAHAPR
jgi:peptidoglycan/LPS O-acetylase OafA/YrhL